MEFTSLIYKIISFIFSFKKSLNRFDIERYDNDEPLNFAIHNILSNFDLKIFFKFFS